MCYSHSYLTLFFASIDVHWHDIHVRSSRLFFLHIQFFIQILFFLPIIKKILCHIIKGEKKSCHTWKRKKKLYFFPYIGIAFHPGIIGIYAWKRLFMYTSTSCFCFTINFVYEHWKCHSLNSPFDCDDEQQQQFSQRLVESHTIVILSFFIFKRIIKYIIL